MTQESPPDGLKDGVKSDVTGRKERVLHTRVPAVLEQELKRFAENLRIPVSYLVRTILEDELNAADLASDHVEERLRKAARQLERERTKLKQVLVPERDAAGAPSLLEGVFAFQEVILARRASCAQCDKLLDPGETAHLGLSDDASVEGRLFVCPVCVPKK